MAGRGNGRRRSRADNGHTSIQVRRTATVDDPPVGLLPGELAVEMAHPGNYARAWVGVPPSIDPAERRLIGGGGAAIPVITTAPFTVPAIGATVEVEFDDASWMVPGLVVLVGGMLGLVLSTVGETVTMKRLYAPPPPEPSEPPQPPDMTGIEWTQRSMPANTGATANGWNRLIFANGEFVAVSGAGTGNTRMATSPDGIDWTLQASPVNSQGSTAMPWIGLAYGDGKFVAVGNSAVLPGEAVATSLDGITWAITPHDASVNNFRDIAFGNGMWVAVCLTPGLEGLGRIMTSPDAVNWTVRAAVNGGEWASVAFGNGVFVAAANNDGDNIMTSPDGINWTAGQADGEPNLEPVSFANGLFFAMRGGANSLLTSPNGIDWTRRAIPDSPSVGFWSRVTYGHGLYCAVARIAPAGFRVMTSPDGIEWTLQETPANLDWMSVAYGNGRFVALASNGALRLMTSPSAASGPTTRASSYRFANRENAPMVSKGQQRPVRQCKPLILRILATSLGDTNNLNKLLNGLHLFLALFCRQDRAMAKDVAVRGIVRETVSAGMGPPTIPCAAGAPCRAHPSGRS
jgi:hypothetical protein